MLSLLPGKGRPGLEYNVPGAKLNPGLCTGRKGTEQLHQVSQKATPWILERGLRINNGQLSKQCFSIPRQPCWWAGGDRQAGVSSWGAFSGCCVGGEHSNPSRTRGVSPCSAAHARSDRAPPRNGKLHLTAWQDKLWNLSFSGWIVLHVMGTKGNANKRKSSFKGLPEDGKGSSRTSISNSVPKTSLWAAGSAQALLTHTTVTAQDLEAQLRAQTAGPAAIKEREIKAQTRNACPFPTQSTQRYAVQVKLWKSKLLQITMVFWCSRAIGSIRIYEGMKAKTLFLQDRKSVV